MKTIIVYFLKALAFISFFLIACVDDYDYISNYILYLTFVGGIGVACWRLSCYLQSVWHID